MGITFSSLEHLLELKRQYGNLFKGRILQLGRQDTFFDFETVINRFVLWGFTVPKDLKPDFSPNPWIGLHLTVSDSTLFKALGFSEIESLDFVDEENPTYVVNLNEEIPKNLLNTFDFIYNGGTIEHDF